MSAIVPRVPRVDWTRGFDRRWNNGSAAVSHVFNALSFLLPQAERFFVDVVRGAASDLDAVAYPALRELVQGFVAQEATHAQQHRMYNQVLEAQGLENVVHRFVDRLQQEAYRHLSGLTRLAFVCGYEHCTAVLGGFILEHPQVLESAAPDIALVWGWHAVEETEHKGVCFDLYRALGGGWARRSLAFIMVLTTFLLLFSRVYASLLYRDGSLNRQRLAGTLRQALGFFFGKGGIAWPFLPHAMWYFGPRFHPWRYDNRAAVQSWMAANGARLREIGSEAPGESEQAVAGP